MKWLTKFMLEKSFYANVLNAILLVLVGLALAFYPDVIGTKSRNFLEYITNSANKNKYTLHWGALAFWFLQLISVFYIINLIHSQGLIEEKKIKDYKTFLDDINRDITGAIHNVPNPHVFSDHGIIYNKILETLRILDLSKQQNRESIELYTKAFQYILSRISILTSSFSPKSNASYCANIMLYYHTADHQHEVHNMIINKKIFPFEISDKDDLFIRGVLKGRKELVYHTNNRKHFPLLNLPILSDKDGSMVYIPGACKAFDLGESVINSTDLNDKTEYDHLPKQLWERLKKFFESDGKEIRSIVSFAIPKPGHFDLFKKKSKKGKPLVLGVLNIDCSEKNIIGDVEQYHQTFFSLMWPIIVQISTYLQNYIYYCQTDDSKNT